MRSFKLRGYTDNDFASPFWEDLTSFITENINIPWTTRNDDGKVTTEGFTLKLVDTIGISVLQNLKYVMYLIDNNARFVGVVNKKSPNTTLRIWEYDIFNGFYDLTKFRIEYGQLHSLLINTADTEKYCSTDNTYYRSCNIPWLLEVLFKVKNLPVDTSQLWLQNPATFVTDHSGRTYYLRDIRIDEYMLYCINQNIATIYSKVDEDNVDLEYSKNKISAFDLLSFITALFQITVRWSGTNYILESWYQPQNSGQNYAITQGDVYDYSSDGTEAKPMPNFAPKGYFRADYYSSVIFNDLFNYEKIVGLGKTIPWYNNLKFLFQNKDLAPGQSLDSFYHFLTYNDLYNSLYLKEARCASKIESFQCALQDTFLNVNSHYFDSRKERSIIKQGVYT